MKSKLMTSQDAQDAIAKNNQMLWPYKPGDEFYIAVLVKQTKAHELVLSLQHGSFKEDNFKGEMYTDGATMLLNLYDKRQFRVDTKQILIGMKRKLENTSPPAGFIRYTPEVKKAMALHDSLLNFAKSLVDFKERDPNRSTDSFYQDAKALVAQSNQK